MLFRSHTRYAGSLSYAQRMRYYRKKYMWLFFIEGTRFLKRFLDTIISLVLLVILSPLMLLIALIIKLYDGGPALFVTPRVGKWGREFLFPKFRSMKMNAEGMKQQLIMQNKFKNDIKFKMENDPRVTPFGYLLRKTSLDELPQLWCVLKGEMSLVGPRPPLPCEVEKYTLEERKRLDAVPGLTCFWQVRGRSEIPFKKQVELDIAYIESQSIWLDLKLILQTIPAILFGKGAY